MRGRVGRARSCRRLPGLLLGGLTALAAWAPATGQTLMTQEEALAVAFPAGAEVERRTAYLSDAQLAEARSLAGRGVEIDQTVVTYYAARRDGRPVGVAYFDAHRVRTKAEVVMVVVRPDGRIDRVDVLKFTEPPEYRAPDGWIEQIEGRRLEDGLSTRGDIVNLTGATLTARALTGAARRVLALHAVIHATGAGS
ncbi:MAG: FMN-binding protein [Gemmatimonadetes bacterium]|nr:FMN-binding protein [Gemmatimonadota bacterium]NIQ53971.1 FMN-binding protein [Gemmatimonadota bacterium]NIU74152.1 FMN-binding protein [Gammaproteobacteria bacterium]NIX44193.1 FMN-binding protein [Gemmatimonadota bacterium]NIY08419.1 FMN-binding protein [Gemmatimonadota bacterium]